MKRLVPNAAAPLTEDELARPLTAEEEADVKGRAAAHVLVVGRDAWAGYYLRLQTTLDAERAAHNTSLGIDAAWRAVEEALPEGWGIRRLERWPGQDWEVVAIYALGGFVKGNGPTPAAALHVLAARLRDAAERMGRA